MRRINMKSNGDQYFCSQPEVDFDTSVNHHLLSSELKSSCVQLAGDPEPCCHAWTDSLPARVKNCNGRSFAMDARIRLDSLKSGCNSPLPCCAMNNSTASNLNSEGDLWDSEESRKEQSALDLVEILDIEDDMRDEETWLYEPLKKHFVEKEPAFRWCRHILDNPSPEMKAARRVLINKLDQNSRHHLYRHEMVSHHAPSFSLDSSVYKTSVDTSLDDSDSLDCDELNTSHDSITTSYRLQDITDVHIMARIQEASLRQDFVSVPATTSLRRYPEMLSSCFNTTVENTDKFAARNKTKAASSSCGQPGLSSLSSSCCQSPTSARKQGCQSPKLTRLHQQVTQFKLLKLVQNQGTSPSRTRSPLRTSLRSLQAVRNSRSLDHDDYQPVGQFSYPLSGVSPGRIRSDCGSSSSASSLNSSSFTHLIKESSVQMATIKKLQRSQSLSPCRIPHPAKGYLSVHGRIFASPERVTTAAWGRRGQSIQR
ncbi:SLAIN motif-containing protein-like [Melanotaenia boesemani]|uniref:SLAIN motif-containing protein-like n=1 Tax=Melanotaenia boesemani TaxID=1250792 RepID=UPI001C04F040|nr:SLAIN motif-containing protein-like [Melanotaenia boesemani]